MGDFIQFPSPTKGKTEASNPKTICAGSTYLEPREFLRGLANQLFGRAGLTFQSWGWFPLAPLQLPFSSLDMRFVRYV